MARVFTGSLFPVVGCEKIDRLRAVSRGQMQLMSEINSGCKATVAIPESGFDKDRVLKALLDEHPGIQVEFQPSQNEFLELLKLEIPDGHLVGGAQMQDPETGKWQKVGGAPLAESIGGTLARFNSEKLS